MFFVRKPTLPSNNPQVECPSCGARNTNDLVQLEEPRTGRVVGSQNGMDPMHASIIVLASGVFSLFITNSVLGPNSNCAAVILTAVLSIGIITIYTVRSLKQQEGAVRVHHYECLYCRNRWTWQEGKPVATYNRRRAIAQDYEEVFGHPPTNED
jgi:hypothetical protein